MKGTSTAEIMNSVLGDKNFGSVFVPSPLFLGAIWLRVVRACVHPKHLQIHYFIPLGALSTNYNLRQIWTA